MAYLEINGRKIFRTHGIESEILMLFQKSEIVFIKRAFYYKSNSDSIGKRILLLNRFKPSSIFDEKKKDECESYLRVNFNGIESLKDDLKYKVFCQSSYNDYSELIRVLIKDEIPNDEIKYLFDYLVDPKTGYLDYKKIPLFHEDGFLILFCMIIDALEEQQEIIYNLTEEYENSSLIYEKILDLAREKGLETTLTGADFAGQILYNSHYIEESKNIMKPKVGEKIIILTEGKSDYSILKKSMKLLREDLSEYFYFMDLESSNSSGSVGDLVKRIKSFVGAGINNRIIALFDNDSAAYEAVKSLERVRIPENIKIIHYPNLDFFRNYPILENSGDLSYDDISTRACSIELYFGDDILKSEKGYVPIKWKSLLTINKLQGVIEEKRTLQKKFYSKLSKCEKDKKLINEFDWRGIEKILDCLIYAFSEK